jgi:hypothetical protein
MNTCYGIKSERTESGLVWHVMEGTRPTGRRLPTFATWTRRLSSHTDYADARAALKRAEA